MNSSKNISMNSETDRKRCINGFICCIWSGQNDFRATRWINGAVSSIRARHRRRTEWIVVTDHQDNSDQTTIMLRFSFLNWNYSMFSAHQSGTFVSFFYAPICISQWFEWRMSGFLIHRNDDQRLYFIFEIELRRLATTIAAEADGPQTNLESAADNWTSIGYV